MADRTRLCLIGFSESAEILLPLSRPTEITAIPQLTARAETNFGGVFSALRDTISRDVGELINQSYRVCRPAVFFLSDGQPTDPATWSVPHAALTDPDWSASPHVIAFGIGDADPVTISRIGRCRAFMSHGGTDPGAVIHGFARALITSIVRSSRVSGATLQVPARVSGFTALPADLA